MKKWNRRVKCSFFWMLCVSLLMLSGCGVQAEHRHFTSEDTLKIVTTIYPMQNFAEEIAGDRAQIINLVPAGMEPHDFELSIGDMQLMEEADIFIYNGAGMEHFVDTMLQSVSNKDLVVVEAVQNVNLLETEHSHGGETAHDGTGHTDRRIDPHTWLSIENAMCEAEVIKDALCKADAKNADCYNRNFDVYQAKLQALADRYEKELSGLSGNTIVVAHEAFGYLCAEHGLVQEAVEGLTADSEPDTVRMKEIIDFCKEHDIQVIFFEELVSPKVAEAIADEVGARTDVLNPIEGRSAEQEEEGLDYIGLMEQNLEALKKALK
ncbi:MAG: metal ABC transporter substrate-binding protein [Clostridium sp.]|nr:metal ABC transporter substrate-binding protein [Clostridium sp.]